MKIKEIGLATIVEISGPHNGYKWLLLDDDGNHHWLTGGQFAMNTPRDLYKRVKLTARTTNNYSLVFAGKMDHV